ncbi:conserved hypothetical protein [Arthrobacter sp. Hiyo4]|nr:conserved hypothetical protein [Arthrobacter sp. Hiyo4]
MASNNYVTRDQEVEIPKLPAGWHVAAETEGTVLWSRDVPLGPAGGITWTQQGTRLSEVSRDDTKVVLRVEEVPTGGGRAALSRLPWPGYSVDGAQFTQRPIGGYLLGLAIPSDAEGKLITISFEPPGWRVGIALWATAVAGMLIWSVATVVRDADQVPRPHGRSNALSGTSLWLLTLPKLRHVRRLWTELRVGDRWAKALVVAAYIFVSLVGVTTSSIGIADLRQDTTSPLGWQFGPSQSIRSDEIHANSAIALSIIATGDAPSVSPLAARADMVHRYPTNGVFEQLVFFDGQMLRLGAFVPHEMLFAAHWWLPTLFLFLAFPSWFKLLGLSPRYGWLAAGLVAFSPANAWWSMLPVAMTAYTAAGCALMIAAFRAFEQMRRVRGSFFAVTAGILIAGMPSSYAPWAILLGAPLLIASTLFVLSRKAPLKFRLQSVGIAGVTAVVFGLGTLWENRAGLAAMTDTVYPGGRRSMAEAQPFGQVFDAPHLWQLLRSVPNGINSSELSTSFTVLFVVAALLFVVSWRGGGWAERIPELTLAGWAALWLAWMTLPLGEWSRSLPMFNMIPPTGFHR